MTASQTEGSRHVEKPDPGQAARWQAAGVAAEVLEMAEGTRTAEDAARAAGCALDQIAKSIIFGAERTGDAVLFITAGGNQVDAAKASALAGEPLGKADAGLIRAQTGFAIGGVAPVGASDARSGPGSTRGCWSSRWSGPQPARRATSSPSRPSCCCA